MHLTFQAAAIIQSSNCKNLITFMNEQLKQLEIKGPTDLNT